MGTALSLGMAAAEYQAGRGRRRPTVLERAAGWGVRARGQRGESDRRAGPQHQLTDARGDQPNATGLVARFGKKQRKSLYREQRGPKVR